MEQLNFGDSRRTSENQDFLNKLKKYLEDKKINSSEAKKLLDSHKNILDKINGKEKTEKKQILAIKKEELSDLAKGLDIKENSSLRETLNKLIKKSNENNIVASTKTNTQTPSENQNTNGETNTQTPSENQNTNGETNTKATPEVKNYNLTPKLLESFGLSLDKTKLNKLNNKLENFGLKGGIGKLLNGFDNYINKNLSNLDEKILIKIKKSIAIRTLNLGESIDDVIEKAKDLGEENELSNFRWIVNSKIQDSFEEINNKILPSALLLAKYNKSNNQENFRQKMMKKVEFEKNYGNYTLNETQLQAKKEHFFKTRIQEINEMFEAELDDNGEFDEWGIETINQANTLQIDEEKDKQLFNAIGGNEKDFTDINILSETDQKIERNAMLFFAGAVALQITIEVGPAVAGSVVPILGTAAGALAGAVVGGTIDLADTFSNRETLMVLLQKAGIIPKEYRMDKTWVDNILAGIGLIPGVTAATKGAKLTKLISKFGFNEKEIEKSIELAKYAIIPSEKKVVNKINTDIDFLNLPKGFKKGDLITYKGKENWEIIKTNKEGQIFIQNKTNGLGKWVKKEDVINNNPIDFSKMNLTQQQKFITEKIQELTLKFKANKKDKTLKEKIIALNVVDNNLRNGGKLTENLDKKQIKILSEILETPIKIIKKETKNNITQIENKIIKIANNVDYKKDFTEKLKKFKVGEEIEINTNNSWYVFTKLDNGEYKITGGSNVNIVKNIIDSKAKIIINKNGQLIFGEMKTSKIKNISKLKNIPKMKEKFKIGDEVIIPRTDGSTSIAKIEKFTKNGNYKVTWKEGNNVFEKTVSHKQIENLKIDLLGKFDILPKSNHAQKLLKKYPELKPTEIINLGGQTFLLSPIIKNRVRPEVLAFIENDGKLETRLFYKSYSDGGWRATPGQRSDKKYSKAEIIDNHSYTVTTKINDKLASKLDNLKTTNGESLLNNFSKIIDNKISPINDKQIYKETKAYNDGGTLKDFNKEKHQPGHLKKFINEKEILSAIKSLDNKYPKGFIPNFRNGPIKSYEINHTIAGKTKIEVFEGKLNGRKIHWEMAQSIKNPKQIWISNIRFPDSKINSFGIDSEFINAGILNNKPFEYNSQLPKNINLKKIGHYKDITPILAHLKPIKEYKQYLKNKHLKQAA